MKTIWKYLLEITDIQVLMLPRGAKILTVQVQNEFPFLWALVSPSEPEEPRTIRIVGTGHPLESLPNEYIGTVQTHGGKLVWHIFEVVLKGATSLDDSEDS